VDDLRHAPSVFDDSFLFSLNYFYTLAPCFIGESILNDHDRVNNSLKAGVKRMFMESFGGSHLDQLRLLLSG